jgi:tetratricopeptide (TPR) repeat protein
MQDFVPVAPPGQGSPANEAPKKRSKKPFIIAGGIVGVILIVIIAVVISTVVAENNRRDSYQAAQVALEQGNYQEALDAFIALGDYEGAVQNAATCQKYLDYTAAQALMDGEQYADALAAFEALRGFEDADALANECQSYLDYDAALGYLETKDYAAARDAFELLAAAGFLDADVQLNKANYALADAAFNAGELETAYNSFTELGDFEDSATRAAACLKPLPSSGELYHNDSYRSSACPVAFEAGNSSWPYYLKIYDGETLVSTLFITAGGSASISLPAGYYTFKTAHGTLWFGEDIMFGENGSYSLMLFDDGNDYAQLENNYEYTITLYIEEGGNVGNRNLDMTDF